MQRPDHQLAADLHMEYRTRADNAAQAYSHLRTDFPLGSFPVHAAQVWRYAMLARAWGEAATSLCGGKVNYLENWRNGNGH